MFQMNTPASQFACRCMRRAHGGAAKAGAGGADAAAAVCCTSRRSKNIHPSCCEGAAPCAGLLICGLLATRVRQGHRTVFIGRHSANEDGIFDRTFMACVKQIMIIVLVVCTRRTHVAHHSCAIQLSTLARKTFPTLSIRDRSESDTFRACSALR